MAKGKMLTASGRANIVKVLNIKKFTLEISKIIKRDHCTVKRFMNVIENNTKAVDQE